MGETEVYRKLTANSLEAVREEGENGSSRSLGGKHGEKSKI